MKRMLRRCASVLALFASGCTSDAVVPSPVPTPTPEPATCQFFPAKFVPFTKVWSTASATRNTDRIVLGQLTAAADETVRSLRLPRTPNEQYCSPVALAPGLTIAAYVPTAAEKTGDYSSFSGLIIDPLTNQPFPGNVIPLSRFPGILGWRVPGP